MSKINELDLISNADIRYDGICTLHPPTLNEIRIIGVEKYYLYLNIITIDLDTYLDKLNLRSMYEGLDGSYKSQCSIFDFLIGLQDTREGLQEALSFFIVEEIQYDSTSKTFLLIKKETNDILGAINRNNFEEIKDGIAQLACMDRQCVKKQPVKSKKAAEIMAKFEEGRKGFAKTKEEDANSRISNLVSAIVAYHGSYNYGNIWSLTVYQLYDLFLRLNTKKQLDTAVIAAFNKDFDYGIWYKNPNSN